MIKQAVFSPISRALPSVLEERPPPFGGKIINQMRISIECSNFRSVAIHQLIRRREAASSQTRPSLAASSLTRYDANSCNLSTKGQSISVILSGHPPLINYHEFIKSQHS